MKKLKPDMAAVSAVPLNGKPLKKRIMDNW